MEVVPPPQGVDPLDAIEQWPPAAPLAALVSADREGAWSRWSILAKPTACMRIEEAAPDPVGLLLETLRSTRAPEALSDQRADAPPFRGGWIAALGYGLGRLIEPSAAWAGPSASPRASIAGALLRCPGAYVHDQVTGRWHVVGDARALPDLRERATPRAWRLDEPISKPDETEYRRMVARALAYIAAGDVYQVNLTRRLRASFEGDARSMFTSVARAMGAWYAGFVEIPGEGAAISFSPEALLHYQASTRRAVTRPIKGTQRASSPPDALLASDKDAAELAMIVDLMRNDLGRVCGLGSVRVDEARALELHGGRGAIASSAVRHAVATASGLLASGRDAADLIAAAFPAGSVTGAPKIRAMQIIEELEPVSRGWYSGSLGYISDAGDACLNVAIRSGALSPDGRTLDYHIGAGIVADSDPAGEWRETCDKAAGFLRAVWAGQTDDSEVRA